MALPSVLERLLSPRLIRFGVVGISGIVVNMAFLAVFYELMQLPHAVSSAAAIEVSIVSNFLLNNAWTFRDRNAAAGASFTIRMIRYNLVSLIGMAVQVGIALLITDALTRYLTLDEPGWTVYPAQLGGIAVAMIWNFASNFYWTWAQKAPVPSAADE